MTQVYSTHQTFLSRQIAPDGGGGGSKGGLGPKLGPNENTLRGGGSWGRLPVCYQ